MNRLRRACWWLVCLGVWLAAPLAVAQQVSNTATIASPAGVIDPNPANNTSTVVSTVWAVTVGKAASPASGSTVVPGQILSYTLTATVTGAEPPRRGC
jgi:hypothetical protein